MTPGQRCDEIIRLIDEALRARPGTTDQAPRPVPPRQVAR
jgi:hypothetical protein